ncbi:MAG: FG-GAP repeat protein [Acidobacteria bacterium]|nr:FG-GAP repeat protein [Acidobacteriota bacterium]
MQKKSIASPSAAVFLMLLLWGGFPGDRSGVIADTDTPFSAIRAAKKEDIRQPVDPTPAVRENISKQSGKSRYDLRVCERTPPLGKESLYRAVNRSQNLNAYFTEHGIRILPGRESEPAWQVEMSLGGYGYGEASVRVKELEKDAIAVSGSRIEYGHAKLTEWYLNDERGLEQGITLQEPPSGKTGQPLVVEWTVSSSLRARVREKGRDAFFCTVKGEPVLHYSALAAWDATGKPLPAKLEVRNNNAASPSYQIVYVVDDARAVYPLTIDPVFAREKKITASDGTQDDTFGHSVSISGNTVVVGAPQESDIVESTGLAYIFERDHGGANNWGQVKKLTASDGARYDLFGFSVSVSGDTVVVGARGDDSPTLEGLGAAYIFERDHDGANNWGQVKKLTASDGEGGDSFGYSVSVSGDTIVVGAPFDGDHGPRSGAAYIFERNYGGANNWGEVKKITGWDVATNDEFGFSVSIGGDVLVAGIPYDDDGGDCSGSAAIFDRNENGPDNWGQIKKLNAFDGDVGDAFGMAVFIGGDTIVVGASGDDDQGIGSGSAYVYGRDEGGPGSWQVVKKIIPSDGEEGDDFGRSVSAGGNRVVVGAVGDDDRASWSGAAYIFGQDHGGSDNWGELGKITASDGAEEDGFGVSVAFSVDTIAVGAYRADSVTAGTDSGAAYVFSPGLAIHPGVLPLLLLDD